MTIDSTQLLMVGSKVVGGVMSLRDGGSIMMAPGKEGIVTLPDGSTLTVERTRNDSSTVLINGKKPVSIIKF